ncbi:stage II sporulation protein M [Novosphingobium sp. FSY-8]|uniref:Stage II sporulation protein M n=1 Tax=Novosphingobium ovatum TaxID=1908523 RepID=A0ABW9XGA8_9SPHN|nr:stage II sporulation protein M [Novosphingobium ovatum]NBC37563.1 stage II sporulation protein M [Novosphingobium ovatum]
MSEAATGPRRLWNGLKERFSGTVPPPPDAGIAQVLRSDRFRLLREGDWRRLDTIVTRLEKGQVRRLSDEDVLEMPVLYRQLVSGLSVARETSLDAATLQWLEALAQRAWFQIHGPQITLSGWLGGFFRGGWSRAVRAIHIDIWIALALMVAGTVVGWMLCAHDPAWYDTLVPGEFIRNTSATREQLHDTLFKSEGEMLGAFAAYLFSHNAQVAILCFALGFAMGLPTLMLLVQNTGQLGAFVWLYAQKGLMVECIGWLSIHGTTELFAILLAGGAGLHVGRSIAFPGARSVLESAAAAGQRAAVVMLGVVLMLVVAGLLEGIGRQTVNDTVARLLIGGVMLTFWTGYFALAGRRGGGAA